MNNEPTTEKELLAKFQSTDPSLALTELFETYADPIYRLAIQLVGDPAVAEDVVQETFISAITHRNSFEGRSKISSWLYRIAYNAALGRLRARHEEPLPEDEPDDVRAPPRSGPPHGRARHRPRSPVAPSGRPTPSPLHQQPDGQKSSPKRRGGRPRRPPDPGSAPARRRPHAQVLGFAPAFQ